MTISYRQHSHLTKACVHVLRLPSCPVVAPQLACPAWNRQTARPYVQREAALPQQCCAGAPVEPQGPTRGCRGNVCQRQLINWCVRLQLLAHAIVWTVLAPVVIFTCACLKSLKPSAMAPASRQFKQSGPSLRKTMVATLSALADDCGISRHIPLTCTIFHLLHRMPLA